MRTWCLQVAGTCGSHITISFLVFSLLFCLSVGVLAISFGVFCCCFVAVFGCCFVAVFGWFCFFFVVVIIVCVFGWACYFVRVLGWLFTCYIVGEFGWLFTCYIVGS